jgi:uncharacterized membrane protein
MHTKEKRRTHGTKWNPLSGFMKFFISGLVTLLPLFLTIAFVGWIFGFLNRWFGMNSLIGTGLRKLAIFFHVPEQLWLAISYLVIIVLIALFGVIVSTVAKGRAKKALLRLFDKIPLINKIYNTLAQIIDLVEERYKESDMEKWGETVIFKFANVHFFGFLPHRKTHQIPSGEEFFVVYLPTSPAPVTGFIFLVPKEDVQFVDISVEDMTKLMVSFGVVGPEVIPDLVPIKKIRPQRDR